MSNSLCEVQDRIACLPPCPVAACTCNMDDAAKQQQTFWRGHQGLRCMLTAWATPVRAHSISYADKHRWQCCKCCSSILTFGSCQNSICENDGRLCNQWQSVAEWLQDNYTVAILGAHTHRLPCTQRRPPECHPCCKKKEVDARQAARSCVMCRPKKQQRRSAQLVCRIVCVCEGGLCACCAFITMYSLQCRLPLWIASLMWSYMPRAVLEWKSPPSLKALIMDLHSAMWANIRSSSWP